MANYLRVTRTIVIEGPIDWVRSIHDKSWCPAPWVGGLTQDSPTEGKRVLCTESTIVESDTPLVTEKPPADQCPECEGRGYVDGGEGCVSTSCEVCGGTGKVTA